MNSLYTRADGLFMFLVMVVLSGLFASIDALAGSLDMDREQTTYAAQLNPAGLRSNMVIFRGSGEPTTEALYYRIYVDGKRIGKIRKNTAFHLELSVGEHMITLNDGAKTKLQVHVSNARVNYIKVSLNKRWQAKLAEVAADSPLLANVKSCSAAFQHRCVKPLLNCCGSQTQLSRYVAR